MEFKASRPNRCPSIFLVLIESDWNLKQCSKKICTEPYRVLIESDWNLKFKNGEGKQEADFSINRIRLEFKVGRGLTAMGGALVLIESDWNLKVIRPIVDLNGISINRIRLEFKDSLLYTLHFSV